MPEVSGDLITRIYSNFRGVDFSNTEVALYRSPDAINMWKDYKKMGTSIETRPDIVLFKELNNIVYGLFFYTINQVDHMIIHCGVSLYDYNMKTKEVKVIKEKGMNVRKSQSFIYRNILYIKDGLNYLQYDGETCKEVIGYIPLTTIGKAPSGGGTANQDVNLLTGVRENSFCADGESTEYVLDANELDVGYQERVFINDVEKTEGFTVDKVNGKVNFTTAPEKPLTDGQDNVVIRFSKTIVGNRDKINKCTILEVFDNRVFFSGNQDYPNTVFHTMLDEPKYCSDLDYYNEGADISPVRDMVAGNNALWVIKEPSQANTAIFYHNPTIDSEAGKVYPSEHSSISTGCIGAAINFNDDIVFFSRRGMEGISGDIATEQVISHRSSLIDSKLLREENYKDMILIEYEGYLLVIIDNKIYLADSRAMFTNENHNEYEWFYWEIDIKPTCAVVYNGELYLGSKQGIFKIDKAFENNKEITMIEDKDEKYFIDGITKQETGAESYKIATGKKITIKDEESTKGLDIKVKGETKQETRSGKNLLNVSMSENTALGTTISSKDGVITINGTSTTSFRDIKWNSFQINQSGNYTFSIEVNGYVDKENNNCILVFQVSDDNSNFTTLKELSLKSTATKQYTVVLDTSKYYRLRLYVPGETTFNSVTIKPQLEYGTEVTDYEPYGVSPSPDYPSEIENIEGKNFLNYKLVTNATSNDTVSLIENGFNVKGLYAGKVVVNNLQKNTDYYLQYLTENITGTQKNVSVFAGASQTTRIKYFTNGIGGTFNTGENTEINIWFYVSMGGSEGEVNFTNIQLEEGSVATEYTPYNSLGFKVIGKNIIPFPYYDKTITRKGVTFTQNDDGSITANGTATADSGYIILARDINSIFTKEGKYALSGITGGSSTTYYLQLYINGKSQPAITTKSKTYSINEGDVINQISFFFKEGVVFNNLVIKPQLEYNEEATAYEPYKSQTEYFPLAEGQKLYEGSYLADDGVHNVKGQSIFKGTENISISKGGLTECNNYYFIFKNTYDIAKKGSKLLCTHFVDKDIWAVDQEGIKNEGTASSYSIRIRANFSTVDDFKSFIAEQYSNGTPVIVEYELAKEEIIPYTEEQQEAWEKIENMKLYDGINHIESTAELDIKYNYIYKKPSIKNKSNIENEITAGEYQTIIKNKRYFIFLQEDLKAVRNSITDKLYIDTNKNIASIIKRVDKLVLNGTEEWNIHATDSNVFYTVKPKNMANYETNIFCTITDEFSKDLSKEKYGVSIDTNINLKIPKVKTIVDLKKYLAKEPIIMQYKATEETNDIILLSKPSAYWTTCEDEFKYPQMQKTTNKRGCVMDVTGEEIDVLVKTNKEQFEKIATHKNIVGYAVNRIKKKKWKSIQLKFSSNKPFELFSCTLESYAGSYVKR